MSNSTHQRSSINDEKRSCSCRSVEEDDSDDGGDNNHNLGESTDESDGADDGKARGRQEKTGAKDKKSWFEHIIPRFH